MPDRPRVLVVGPLPPPLGGVQLLVEMLLRSSLSRDHNLRVVNTSKGVLRWAVETPTWRTVPYFVRDLFALAAALARFRPDLVIVHAAPSPRSCATGSSCCSRGAGVAAWCATIAARCTRDFRPPKRASAARRGG